MLPDLTEFDDSAERGSLILQLPDISAIASSKQAFCECFLRAGYILSRHLERIEYLVSSDASFKSVPRNSVVLGLFSKLRQHYYSSVLLEIHQDYLGNQFLVEQLCETIITLTYLLEEADEQIFQEYITASVCQTHQLVAAIETQLRQFPEDPDLLALKRKLNFCITQQQTLSISEFSNSNRSSTGDWGPEAANTTAKRGRNLGLYALINIARTLTLTVKAASWLDLQLNYLYPNARSSPELVSPDSAPPPPENFSHHEFQINTLGLRNTAHLCLHAARSFIETVALNHQLLSKTEENNLYTGFDQLFQWFYNAHNAYDRLFESK